MWNSQHVIAANVCNNSVHEILYATLLSGNDRDTRICNTCSSIPEGKIGKHQLSNSTKLQKGMSKKSKTV